MKSEKVVIVCLIGLVALGSILFVIQKKSFFATEVTVSAKKVFISQVVDHPALTKTTEGIIAGLAKEGFSEKDENLTLRIESAQGNGALAAQIASKYVGQEPDVVVGVGTLSAQSFMKYVADERVTLVFSSVTDPVVAHLITQAGRSEKNVTGVSNFVSLEPQLDLIKRINPNCVSIGVLYNPAELNSIAIIDKLEKLVPLFGFSLKTQAVTKTADVAQAAVKLAFGVDALFISNDNTALSSIQTIVQAANDAKIPLYVSDTDSVDQGALAAIGPNQFEIGFQTGLLIAKILRGEKPLSLPVEGPRATDLVVNTTALTRLNLTLPPAFVGTARFVSEKTREGQ